MEDRFKVGVITSTHGVRGEVKVFPTTDDPKRFRKLKTVQVETTKETLTLAIQSVKFFKNMVIVKFEGIDSLNDVEQYRKAELYVSRKDAVPLAENEYYIADLIGLSVESDEGERLGELTDVLQTGANDVYVVQTPEVSQLLIPAIRDCIKEVAPEEGRMVVHLLPGLR